MKHSLMQCHIYIYMKHSLVECLIFETLLGVVSYTAIPRLTKIIRSGITFVSRNVISRRFYRKSFNSFWMLPTI